MRTSWARAFVSAVLAVMLSATVISPGLATAPASNRPTTPPGNSGKTGDTPATAANEAESPSPVLSAKANRPTAKPSPTASPSTRAPGSSTASNSSDSSASGSNEPRSGGTGSNGSGSDESRAGGATSNGQGSGHSGSSQADNQASESRPNANRPSDATARPTPSGAVAAAEARAERLLERAGLDEDDQSGERANYIVRFTAGTDARAQATRLRSQKVNVKRTFTNVFPGVVAAMRPKQLEALIRAGRVADVQPDGFVSTTDATNLWGLDRIDQAALPLDSTFAPAITTAGSGVSVYIIDTGVRADHVAFTGRVASGFTAIADGNGTSDCNGHGTHVAGTAAGVTYGLASSATIYPVRVLDCGGSGTWSGVIAGIDWVIAHHADGVPAVANLSLGGGVNSTVDTAISRLISDGVATVVAAGNSNTDACTSSPARVPAAITVAASDIADARASFSNYGSCVDLFAPGVGITSSVPSSTTSTAAYSGTSMAAPHVAGAVALLLGAGQPASGVISGATPDVISSVAGSPNRLLYVATADSVTPEPTPPPAELPDAPASATSVAGVRSITVTWQPGASDGGSPLTGYVVRVTGAINRTYRVTPDRTSFVIERLRAGRTHVVAVAAVNAVGQSTWVSAGSAVPLSR